jgi:hypothetical protein
MLFLTALLGDKVSVYHCAALRAVTDWWVCAQIYEFSGISAISVRSSFLLKGVMINAAFPVLLMVLPQ